MPLPSPLVSPPRFTPPPSAPPRRLIEPLGRLRDLELERARSLAAKRARKRRRQTLALRLGLLACVALPALWIGARGLSRDAGWPRGAEFSSGVAGERAPIYVAGSWVFAGADGSVWRARNGAAPARLWVGTLPGTPQVVAIGNEVLVAGADGALVRFDGAGRVRWSARNERPTAARPVVCAQNILVSADDGGQLWARDAATGRALWSQDLNAPPGEGLAATPWGVAVPLLGGVAARGGLRCFSNTGRKLWDFPANPRERAAGTATPRFDATTQRLFWCNDEGAVFALDARTGHKIWKSWARPVGPSKSCVVLRASPVLVGGAVVVGGDDGILRAFDARDGHALWTRALGQPLAAPLGKARWAGSAVVLAGEAPATLVDARNGVIVRTLGAGRAACNGRDWAATGARGDWHFWRAD